MDKSAVLIAFGMGKTKGSKGRWGGANSAILRALSLGYATGVGDGGGGGLTQSCNT